MNLLARILSHGFALALVVLIAIALMYRGELFPEWELPEFLVIDDNSNAIQSESSAGAVTTSPEIVAPETAKETTVDTVVMPAATDQGSPAVDKPVTAAPLTGVSDQPQDESEQQPADVIETPADESVEEGQPPAASPAADAIDSAAEEPSVSAPMTEPEPQLSDTDTPDGGDGAAALPSNTLANEQPAVVVDTPKPVAAEPEAAVEPRAEPAQQLPQVVPDAPEPVAAEPEAAFEPGAEPSQQQPQVVAETPEPVAAEPEAAVESGAEPAQQQPQVVADTPEPVAAEPEAAVEPGAETESLPPAATLPPQLVEPSTAAVGSSSEKTAYELLAVAREAYWLRDYDEAEKLYQQLIQLEPDNPDGYGELGNMYFAQGQWEQAAAAYYEAGVRMVNDGMVVEARQLVDVIRGLNGSQADELLKHVDAAGQDTP